MGRRRSVLDLAVRQIVEGHPRCARVFIELRTQCVGCQMAGFCTLRDVAASYSLDLERLVGLLEKEMVIGG